MSSLRVHGGVSVRTKNATKAATQAEVDAGTVTNKYVSPKTLTDWSGGGGGSGDVVGPASVTDSNFAAFDSTTGKLIKDSGSASATFATAAQGAKVDFLTVTQAVDLDTLESNVATNNAKVSGNRATLFKDNVSASVTGTTAETMMTSGLIPASSVEENDILEFFVRHNKPSSIGNTTLKVYVNETNDLTTPTLLATIVNTSGNVYGSLIRRLVMKNSVSSAEIIDDATVLTPDDVIQGTAAIDTISFDFSAAFYFIVTITPSNSGDTLTFRNAILERIR